MTRHLATLLVLALLPTTLAAWSFEDPACLDGWAVATTGSGIVERSTAHAHTGTQSLRLLSNSTSAASASMPLSIDPNKDYEIVFWYYTTCEGWLCVSGSGPGSHFLDTGHVGLLWDGAVLAFEDRHGSVWGQWAGFGNQWHEARIIPHGRPQRCMAWPGAEVAVVLAREGVDVPFRFTYAYPLG